MTTESAVPKLDKNDPDVIVRPYRFALKPTATQERKLRQHTGAARFAYNHLIAQWRDDIHTRIEEKERGVPEDELTPFSFKLSTYDIRNHWNHIKRECAPWYSEVSKEIGEDAARRAYDSIENWYDSKNGRRKGRRMGLPRFHKRGCHESCTFWTGAIRVNTDRHSVTLPRIGTIRTYENTRKLQRKIAKGTARIAHATISEGSSIGTSPSPCTSGNTSPRLTGIRGRLSGSTWVWEIMSSSRRPHTVMKSCAGDCRKQSPIMTRGFGTFNGNCRANVVQTQGRKPRPRIGGFAQTIRFASITT